MEDTLYQQLRSYAVHDLKQHLFMDDHDTVARVFTRLAEAAGGSATAEVLEHEIERAQYLWGNGNPVMRGYERYVALTPRERAAVDMLRKISQHRLIAFQRELETLEPLTSEQHAENWQLTIEVVRAYAVFLPEREAAVMLEMLEKGERAALAQFEPQADAPAIGPQSVTTRDVACAFNGLRGWDEKTWKKTLGSPPKWLENCIATRGQRGVRETRWNPVLIGAALVSKGHARQNSVRAKFQTMPQLTDWLEAWKTYEADNLDTQ